MYERNQGEINFGLSECKVRVSEGTSYRESTVRVVILPFLWTNLEQLKDKAFG